MKRCNNNKVEAVKHGCHGGRPKIWKWLFDTDLRSLHLSKEYAVVCSKRKIKCNQIDTSNLVNFNNDLVSTMIIVLVII